MRPRHRLAAALVGLASQAASIHPARAQVAMVAPAPPPPAPGEGVLTTQDLVPLFIWSTAFLLVDAGFGIYDGVRAGNGALPSRGVGIAQASVASLQVVTFDTLHVVLSVKKGDSPYLGGLVLLPGLANSLFIHGVWASQTPALPAGVPLGVSATVGFDTALTASILARAGTGHLSGRGMGVAQMVLTAPSIAAFAYEGARDPSDKGAWAGLAAWSGAIFAHGLVSAIAGASAPPPPPAAPPAAPPEKPPLLVPASLHLGPVPMAGGGGVALGGQWL
jgi:hypothetical protein